MHRKLFYILLYLTLFIEVSTKAIFTEIFECASPLGPIVICCADTHNECEDRKIAYEQQDALFAQVQKLAVGKKVHVIVEDISEYQGDKKKLKELFQRSAIFRQSPLYGLAQRCRSDDIACSNVEFRHINQVIADGFLKLESYDRQSKELNDFLKLYDIELADLMVETTKIFKEIKSYDDDSIFQTMYESCLTETDYLINEVRNIECQLQEIPPQHSMQLLKMYAEKIKMVDCQLLDARILHELYIHRDKDYIFICAGGTHIQNIIKGLFLKYYQVKKCDVHNRFDYTLNGKTKAKNTVNVRSFFTSDQQNYLRSEAEKKAAAEKPQQMIESPVKKYQFLKGILAGFGISAGVFGLYKWLKK